MGETLNTASGVQQGPKKLPPPWHTPNGLGSKLCGFPWLDRISLAPLCPLSPPKRAPGRAAHHAVHVRLSNSPARLQGSVDTGILPSGLCASEQYRGVSKALISTMQMGKQTQNG